MKKSMVLGLIFMNTVAMADLAPIPEVRPVKEDYSRIEYKVSEPEKPKHKQVVKISLQEQLFKAIREENIGAVKSLLKQGVDVNALKKDREMISCGPACDAYERVEYSPLHIALKMKEEFKKEKETTQKDLADPESYEQFNTKEEMISRLKYYEQKEKNMEGIIKLLKGKGAKDISRKIDSPAILER